MKNASLYDNQMMKIILPQPAKEIASKPKNWLIKKHILKFEKICQTDFVHFTSLLILQQFVVSYTIFSTTSHFSCTNDIFFLLPNQIFRLFNKCFRVVTSTIISIQELFIN